MPLPGVRHNDKERASGAINNQKPLGRGEKSTGRGGRDSATGSGRFGGGFLADFQDCKTSKHDPSWIRPVGESPDNQDFGQRSPNNRDRISETIESVPQS